jgi:hypothetical protein
MEGRPRADLEVVLQVHEVIVDRDVALTVVDRIGRVDVNERSPRDLAPGSRVDGVGTHNVGEEDVGVDEDAAGKAESHPDQPAQHECPDQPQHAVLLGRGRAQRWRLSDGPRLNSSPGPLVAHAAQESATKGGRRRWRRASCSSVRSNCRLAAVRAAPLFRAMAIRPPSMPRARLRASIRFASSRRFTTRMSLVPLRQDSSPIRQASRIRAASAHGRARSDDGGWR